MRPSQNPPTWREEAPLATECPVDGGKPMSAAGALQSLDIVEIAGLLQPFAYLRLVTAASLGVAVFGEGLSWTTQLGSSIVVMAGFRTSGSSADASTTYRSPAGMKWLNFHHRSG